MRASIFYVIILLCLQATILVACGHAPLAIADIEGTWTRQKYIDTVRSTRSPFSELPETLTFKDNKLYWTTYHEGSWRKITRIEAAKTKGVYQLVVGKWEIESPGPEMVQVPFKPEMNRAGKVEAITFFSDAVVTHKQEPFVRVPTTLERLVAQFVLIGTYQDEKGQSYLFDKSGIAIWPGLSFSYEVALDSTEAFCDYFLVDYNKNPVNTKTYGFKWVGGKMELFNIKGDDWGVNCEDRPFAILTPQMQ